MPKLLGPRRSLPPDHTVLGFAYRTQNNVGNGIKIISGLNRLVAGSLSTLRSGDFSHTTQDSLPVVVSLAGRDLDPPGLP